MMTLISRLKYPDTCTFTVAQAHNPIDQYMYECIDCGQTICLVCRDLCHPYCAWETSCGEIPVVPAIQAALLSPAELAPLTKFFGPNSTESGVPRVQRKRHTLRPLGLVAATYCCCVKTTCRAIGAIDPREAAGFTWTPSPIDTRSVSVSIEAGSELGMLVEKLAWNSHEVR